MDSFRQNQQRGANAFWDMWEKNAGGYNGRKEGRGWSGGRRGERRMAPDGFLNVYVGKPGGEYLKKWLREKKNKCMGKNKGWFKGGKDGRGTGARRVGKRSERARTF